MQACLQVRSKFGGYSQACLQTWSLLRSLGLPAPCARAQWPPVRLLGFSKGSVVVNQVRGPFKC